jgi:hypothetical protein
MTGLLQNHSRVKGLKIQALEKVTYLVDATNVGNNNNKTLLKLLTVPYLLNRAEFLTISSKSRSIM